MAGYALTALTSVDLSCCLFVFKNNLILFLRIFRKLQLNQKISKMLIIPCKKTPKHDSDISDRLQEKQL